MHLCVRATTALLAMMAFAALPVFPGGVVPAGAAESSHSSHSSQASQSLQPAPRILPGGEWVLADGETPRTLARLLFPGQPGMQRRFISLLAAENPHLDFTNEGDLLRSGTVLRMPDWKAFAASSRQRVAVGSSPAPVPSAADGEGGESRPTGHVPMPRAPHEDMWLSAALSPAPLADAATRQWLRLEYRLLALLESRIVQIMPAASPETPGLLQLPSLSLADTSQVTEAPDNRASPVTAPSAASVEQATVSAAPASNASSPAVNREREPLTESAKAVASATEDAASILPYVAGGASLLLLLALLLRRRRAVTAHAPLADAETLVLESPAAHFARTPSADVHAVHVKDSPMAPAAPAVAAAPSQPAETPPPLTHAVPAAPDTKDANPVLELAEIMLSFGRVQGAAQTLEEYLQANPGEAVQPWVLLLQIYREAGMHVEFDTLAGRFHQRFNVELQQWAADAAPPTPRKLSGEAVPRALTIEDLPHVRERLIATWGSAECLDYLRTLLRENRGGQRTGFTLPVVQEMLLLIDILACRDAD